MASHLIPMVLLARQRIFYFSFLMSNHDFKPYKKRMMMISAARDRMITNPSFMVARKIV